MGRLRGRAGALAAVPRRGACAAAAAREQGRLRGVFHSEGGWRRQAGQAAQACMSRAAGPPPRPLAQGAPRNDDSAPGCVYHTRLRGPSARGRAAVECAIRPRRRSPPLGGNRDAPLADPWLPHDVSTVYLLMAARALQVLADPWLPHDVSTPSICAYLCQLHLQQCADGRAGYDTGCALSRLPYRAAAVRVDRDLFPVPGLWPCQFAFKSRLAGGFPDFISRLAGGFPDFISRLAGGFPDFISRLAGGFPDFISRLAGGFPDFISRLAGGFPDFISRLAGGFPDFISRLAGGFPDFISRLAGGFPDFISRLAGGFPDFISRLAGAPSIIR